MRILVSGAIVVSIVAGILLRNIVGISECVLILKSLSQISLAMFGVIGVWLSLLYRDEIITGLWKDHETVESQCKAAELVLSANERCGILFRGFLLVVTIFVLSWMGAQTLPILHKALCTKAFAHGEVVCAIVHSVAVSFVLFLVFAQGYVLLTSIAPIGYISNELKTATEDANMVLRTARRKTEGEGATASRGK